MGSSRGPPRLFFGHVGLCAEQSTALNRIKDNGSVFDPSTIRFLERIEGKKGVTPSTSLLLGPWKV
jgi:hypothetical protein